MADLELYYNKFNEDKRLLSRHGQVEFFVSLKYIHDYLFDGASIIDVGAGTGRYSIFLSKEGYDVTSLEYCKCNLGVLKANAKKEKVNIKSYLGNAIDLSKFADDSFDFCILFGPMYHLHGLEQKVQALKEASRVTKRNGIIFVAYYMNDYCVITYGFRDNNIQESFKLGKINDEFHCTHNDEDLYDPVRKEDIDEILQLCNLERIKLVGVDGPTDYMRNVINNMDEKTFDLFKKYCLSISGREDMVGMSSHTIDIIKNSK